MKKGLLIIVKLSASREGVNFLQTSNVLPKLQGVLANDTEPTNGMLVPRVMQFLGSLSARVIKLIFKLSILGRKRSKIIGKYLSDK